MLARLREMPPLAAVSWQHVAADTSEAELRARGFDTVLDVDLTRIDALPSENMAQVSLKVGNNVTLTDLDDELTLASRHYEQFTEPHKLSSWVADDSTLVAEALGGVFDDISTEFSADFFADSPIRVTGLEPVARDVWRRGRIDSLKPLIIWQATDANQTIKDTYPLEYELMLYAGDEAPNAGVRVPRPRWVPPELLESCTRYRWRVRAHYVSYGREVASPSSPEYRFGTPCD